MTVREYFIELVKNETSIFERVIHAIPEGNREWKPDAKSKTALELASTMAGEGASLGDFLEKGTFDFGTMVKPTGEPNALAEALTAQLNRAKEIANKMTEEEWMVEASAMMNGKDAGWKMPRGPMVFSLLMDLIHHRGQLSTYLRAMGGKVPSIYGPSADSTE